MKRKLATIKPEGSFFQLVWKTILHDAVNHKGVFSREKIVIICLYFINDENIIDRERGYSLLK